MVEEEMREGWLRCGMYVHVFGSAGAAHKAVKSDKKSVRRGAARGGGVCELGESSDGAAGMFVWWLDGLPESSWTRNL